MPTTNERLTREISAQAEQFDEIFANDDPFDELWEAPLEVTTRTQLVVTLCIGGPHVKAVADLDNDGAIVSASIVGYWGSETVQQPVEPGGSPPTLTGLPEDEVACVAPVGTVVLRRIGGVSSMASSNEGGMWSPCGSVALPLLVWLGMEVPQFPDCGSGLAERTCCPDCWAPRDLLPCCKPGSGSGLQTFPVALTLAA